MATNSQESHRKHSRSPSDDESPESSKRHKHRHHHRRHRHHHRNTSKKHDDEIQQEEVVVRPIVADYDMEEGEIVDDDVFLDKNVHSDVESGEFREFDDLQKRVPAGDNNRTGGKNNDVVDGEQSLLKSIANGASPSKGSSEQPSLNLKEMDEDENGKQINLSSRVRVLETSDRSRSASLDRTRERERSQSILPEKPPRIRHRRERDERMYDNGKVHDELDEERDRQRSTGYRFDSSDIVKSRRERSSSLHRSSTFASRDEHADYRDREREDNAYKDKKKVKDQVISRERSGRDDDCDRLLDKERNGDGGRDRDWNKELDRDRGKLRDVRSDMDRGTERDRERRRDKDRGQSRDRDLDRDKGRDNNIARYRDRDTEREWDDRLGDRDRKMERDRNSSRDRPRDVERDRSRRYHKYDDRHDGYGSRDRHRGYDELNYQRNRDRKNGLDKNRGREDDSQMENLNDVNRDDGDPKDYQERVDLVLAEQDEDDDADRIKEQSRRLREAILQKYKAKQSPHDTMPQSSKASSEELEEHTSKDVVITFAVQENIQTKSDGQDSCAVETAFDLGKSPSNNDTAAVVDSTSAGGLGEGTPKSEMSNDMFCDDIFGESPVRKTGEKSNDMFCDDIFGESPAGVRKTGKGDGLPVERSGLHDNWDDPEGYYSFRFGEILDSRYEITAQHGKGVFSTVVRAKDLKAGAGDPEEVAIKIIRNNETMLKAGTEELVILNKLVGADQDDRRHCVRYLSHFKYRNHLCIVFESLHMNLREVLKKFGRNIGLKLTAVRAYSKQLFIALKHLRNCGVLHCDIKPDNMLVNDAKNVLKLCDFGNAMFAGKNEVTPYLVSRFYRAPEIVLGLTYDHPMDMWSVGCCLYEVYTGKVLFPGSTNNDMLRLHMELKGLFPKKMLRKGAFVEKHFDSNLNFLAIEEDPVTKKPIRRLIVNIKPKDVGTIIKGSPGEDPKMLANFKDLLDKIFALDPEKRLTVSQALSHPFITGK